MTKRGVDEDGRELESECVLNGRSVPMLTAGVITPALRSSQVEHVRCVRQCGNVQ